MTWPNALTPDVSPIKGNRAPEDHLEVRCTYTGKLLGWISGIDAKKVSDTEDLVFKGQDDDAMVIEHGDGTSDTVCMDTIITVAGFEATFTGAELEDLKTIHAQVPAYAVRRRFITGEGVKTAVYTWTAAVVEIHEAQDLFDFDNFVPYGEPSEKLMWEDKQFHGAGLLKKATPAPTGKMTMAELSRALNGRSR